MIRGVVSHYCEKYGMFFIPSLVTQQYRIYARVGKEAATKVAEIPFEAEPDWIEEYFVAAALYVLEFSDEHRL